MNKRGYLQTLEAAIVVVIIVTIILGFRVGDREETDIPESVREAQKFILKMLDGKEYRNEFFSDDVKEIRSDDEPPTTMMESIKKNVTPGFDYVLQVCKLESDCAAPLVPNRGVYLSSAILIKEVGKKADKRILKLYFCEDSCIA